MKQRKSDDGEIGGRMPHINLVTHYVRRGDRVAVDMREAGMPECVVLGRMTYKHAYPGLPEHVHDKTAELVFSKTGSQPYRVAGRVFTMIAGRMYVIPPDTPHSNDGHPSYPGVRYWLQFTLPQKEPRQWMGLTEDVYRPLVDWLRVPPERGVRYPADLPDRLDRILAFMSSCAGISTFTACRIRIDLLSILFDLYALSQSSQKGKTDQSRIVERWIRWANARESLPSLEDFSREFHASKPVITRFFREVTGVPPHLYFLRQRIERAQKLILEGQESVTSIAQRCGFSTSQYFSTLFKKISGVSPRAFAAFVARQKISRQDGQT